MFKNGETTASSDDTSDIKLKFSDSESSDEE